MTVHALKIGREKMVVMRERDYLKLQRRVDDIDQQEAGDVAESRRRMKETGGVSLADVRKRLGI